MGGVDVRSEVLGQETGRHDRRGHNDSTPVRLGISSGRDDAHFAHCQVERRFAASRQLSARVRPFLAAPEWACSWESVR